MSAETLCVGLRENLQPPTKPPRTELPIKADSLGLYVNIAAKKGKRKSKRWNVIGIYRFNPATKVEQAGSDLCLMIRRGKKNKTIALPNNHYLLVGTRKPTDETRNVTWTQTERTPDHLVGKMATILTNPNHPESPTNQPVMQGEITDYYLALEKRTRWIKKAGGSGYERRPITVIVERVHIVIDGNQPDSQTTLSPLHIDAPLAQVITIEDPNLRQNLLPSK